MTLSKRTGANLVARLDLPFLVSLGFIEVLILMFVMVWLAGRYSKKHANIQA